MVQEHHSHLCLFSFGQLILEWDVHLRSGRVALPRVKLKLPAALIELPEALVTHVAARADD
jgi:hypothetical protein